MDPIIENLRSFDLTDAAELRARRLEHFDANQIQEFFEEHREIVSERPIRVGSPNPATDIFPDSWSSSLPVQTIKQLCLYSDRIYIHDPILEAERRWRELDIHPNYATLSDGERIDKFKQAELLRPLLLLNTIGPLMDAGVVEVVPSQLIGGEEDPRAIEVEDFFGPGGTGTELADTEHPFDTLSPSIREYFTEQLQVLPARWTRSGKIKILRDRELTGENVAALMFPSDDQPLMYPRFEIVDTERTGDDGGLIRTSLEFDFDPDEDEIDPDRRAAWLRSIRRKYAIQRLRNLERDLAISAVAGAQLLTSAPANRDLLALSTNAEPPATPVYDPLLELNLPYMDQITPEDLARARQNEAAFARFRSALNESFSELADLSPSERRRQAGMIADDLLRARVDEIDDRLSELTRRNVVDATLLAGVFTVGVAATQDPVAVGGALGFAQRIISGFRDSQDEEHELKTDPSYFYWEAAHG